MILLICVDNRMGMTFNGADKVKIVFCVKE